MSTPKDKLQESNNKPTPFRRVVTEKVEVDPRLKDNSFDAKVNAPKIFKKAKAIPCTTSINDVLQHLRPHGLFIILGIYLWLNRNVVT